jgi:hypothetical protein
MVARKTALPTPPAERVPVEMSVASLAGGKLPGIGVLRDDLPTFA